MLQVFQACCRNKVLSLAHVTYFYKNVKIRCLLLVGPYCKLLLLSCLPTFTRHLQQQDAHARYWPSPPQRKTEMYLPGVKYFHHPDRLIFYLSTALLREPVFVVSLRHLLNGIRLQHYAKMLAVTCTAPNNGMLLSLKRKEAPCLALWSVGAES